MSLTWPRCLNLSKKWRCFAYIENLYQECWQRNNEQAQVDHHWADQSSRKQLWPWPKLCQRLWNLKFSCDPKSKWQCLSHEVPAELHKWKVMLEVLFIWRGILHRKFVHDNDMVNKEMNTGVFAQWWKEIFLKHLEMWAAKTECFCMTVAYNICCCLCGNNSAGILAILTEVFQGFPHSFEAKFYDCFLSNLLKFISHSAIQCYVG